MKRSYPTSALTAGAMTLLTVLLLGGNIAAAQTSTAPKDPAKEEGDKVVLPTFTVDASRDDGYIGSNSLSASRAAINIADMPSSVIVITRQLIDDIGAFDVYDTLHYVSGVSDSSMPAQDGLAFKIRGTGATVATDGFRLTGEGTADLSEVERVEVLKGPSAILFARGGSAGGTVNRITKMPLEVAQGYVKVQAGQYDANRLEVDSTGPVPKTDGKLLYRLVMAAQDSDGYFENTFNKRYIFNPALTYKFSPDTYATLKYSYHRVSQSQYVGVPINVANPTDLTLENHLYDVPTYRTVSDPNEAQETWRHHVDFLSGTKVASFMRTSLNAQYSDTKYLREVSRPNGSPLVAADGSVPRFWSLSWAHNYRYRLYSDSVMQYNLGPTSNTTIFGIDLLSDAQGDQSANATNINIAPTNLYQQPTAVSPRPFIPFTKVPSSYTNSAQAYLMQSLKAFNERLIISGGLTRNWVNVNNYTAASTTWAEQNTRADTNQYGIVVRPYSWASFYYGYNENFDAQFVRLGQLQPDGTYADAGAAPPRMSESQEFGFKATTADGRLSASIAHFDTDLTNRTRAIIGTPYIELQGGGSYTGWETDIFYRPVKNVSIIFSASHTKAVDTAGRQIDTVAENTVNGLVRYDIPKGVLKGLGVSLSANYQDKYLINPYWVKARVVMDAGLFYKWKKYQFQMNVGNLTDKRYIAGGFLPARVFLGAGRVIKLSATRRW